MVWLIVGLFGVGIIVYASYCFGYEDGFCKATNNAKDMCIDIDEAAKNFRYKNQTVYQDAVLHYYSVPKENPEILDKKPEVKIPRGWKKHDGIKPRPKTRNLIEVLTRDGEK